jgi:uncharacterized circularly permuted ATP-grasp superfamily protein/uncharacterized alpha-E superfamily protein
LSSKCADALPHDADALGAKLASWLAGYRLAHGTADELLDAGGRLREHWRALLSALAKLGEADIDQRFAGANRRIDEMGVTYRAPGEARERAAPLARLPLLLPQSEWEEIEAGIVQRAELLDLVLSDIYGEGRLIAEGALPATVVTGSPEFIRPMRGVTPPGGRWLRFYAAEIARGPDGAWRVLGDRAQAPSGAGYALENRLIMARAVPSLFRDMNVRRMAPFFRDFRAGLASCAQRVDPRICLLTPGPFSETYAEQVNLARYLGLLLVEGEDLVANDGKLYVRTIAGLKRADVLWRRVDADWCDPLELNAASKLGAPGLLEAIRQGAVAVANMPGAGLVEARALMSFLPALALRLLGEELRLPNVDTLWCGDDATRAQVLASLDTHRIKDAFAPAPMFRTTFPGGVDAHGLPTVAMSPAHREKLVAAIMARGMDFVAQEELSFSTTPAWVDGALTPRPFALRVFAAATKDGWRVMPGGYCRVYEQQSRDGQPLHVVAPCADVWVLSEEKIEAATLLPPADDARIVRVLGSLPSRAADNLFWMGRYLERTEAVLRIVRCLCNRLTEAQAPHAEAEGLSERQPINRLRRLLIAWGCVEEETRDSPAAALALAAVGDAEAYGSARANAMRAKGAASILRERLSPDVWQLIGGLETRLQRAATLGSGAQNTAAATLGSGAQNTAAATLGSGAQNTAAATLDNGAQNTAAATLDNGGRKIAAEPEIVDCVERALHTLAALSGLMDENFNRVAGWNFLDLGKRVERAINTCRFARQFADAGPTMDSLDALIELIDSQITYRSRYLSGAALAPVLDMAMLDPYNPRSVSFQIARIDDHLSALPALVDDGVMEAPRRLAVRLRSELETEEARRLSPGAILKIEQRLNGLADAVAKRYFLQGGDARRPDKRSQLA